MSMTLLGAAMVVGCALHLVLVGRAHDWHPLHLACPVLMLLAMVDTCLVDAGVLSGTVWAALLVLAATATFVFAPVARAAGHSLRHSLGALAVVAALLALPSAASAAPTGMTGMTGMHQAAGVPAWLWWAALAAVVVVAATLAVRALAHGARSRRLLALVGLAEVGLMAAMVLPATA